MILKNQYYIAPASLLFYKLFKYMYNIYNANLQSHTKFHYHIISLISLHFKNLILGNFITNITIK